MKLSFRSSQRSDHNRQVIGSGLLWASSEGMSRRLRGRSLQPILSSPFSPSFLVLLSFSPRIHLLEFIYTLLSISLGDILLCPQGFLRPQPVCGTPNSLPNTSRRCQPPSLLPLWTRGALNNRLLSQKAWLATSSDIEETCTPFLN